ncbi:class I adenylate-forming enzyme family protein [Nocardia brasiliensis]|uniref:class I adenylate-forming enzyme family protein n=1 Tax=Nocardia brasiliensis TaxID=37326 RepID=UPI00366D9375
MTRLKYSHINIGLLFDWHADRAGQTIVHVDRPADIAPDLGTAFDANTLAATVRDLASALYAAGARHGDKVVIVKDNHFDSVLVAAGAARIGALPVLISPFVPLPLLPVMIAKAAPRLVIAGTTLLAAAVASSVELAPAETPIVTVGEPRDDLPDNAVPLDEFRGAAAVSARPTANAEPMIVTHTSGTTGVPKFVVHSADTAIHSLPPRLERFPLPFMTSRRDDIVAAAIPFFHIRAFLWTASQLAVGPRAMVALSDPAPTEVAKALAAFRPTHVETLPNVFQLWEELADRQPELFARTRLFTSTFDAVHTRTVRKFLNASQRRFPVWAWALAQSEIHAMVGGIVTRPMVNGRRRERSDLTTVGFPPMVRARVVDPVTGQKVPHGTPGLLMISAKGRCLTYLGEDERHRSKVDGNWWNSGDMAVSLGFGRYRMVDREVDMIPGMSCIELESTLLDRLANATEIVVLAIPGNLPLPVVCMRDDRLEPAEWAAATHGLPAMQQPRVVPWDQVPRTGTWKVQRAELRARLVGTAAGIGSGNWI